MYTTNSISNQSPVVLLGIYVLLRLLQGHIVVCVTQKELKATLAEWPEWKLQSANWELERQGLIRRITRGRVAVLAGGTE